MVYASDRRLSEMGRLADRMEKQRQESIHTLEFPFSYRQGQKKLVADVYRTILRGKNLFIEAPTGVGKQFPQSFRR